jgi:hypothetical protein
LTDQGGETRTSITNPFGYYQFEDVSASRSYVLDVSAKRYRFAPQIVTVTDDNMEINFSAQQ